MQILKFFIVVSCFVVSSIVFAQANELNRNPDFVRIRMFKDLSSFPRIQYAETKRINKFVWSVVGDNLEYLNKKLPHTNVIIFKQDNKFDLISIVNFNEYLAGVVSQEMPTSWPLEALKAQAVVARSFALARIKERQNKSFHLESNQADQVYQASQNRKAMMAVYSTNNLVLETDSGKVLKAYYHADCGGQTVKASDVWGARAYDSGTASDPWCAVKNSNRWSYEISRSEFINKLNLNENNLAYLAEINIAHKSQLIQIAESFFSIQRIRQILGFTQVRSSFNKIELNNNEVKISGQGFGHGAGLCQWGTLAQVRMGRTFKQIITHYYPKALLIDVSN